MDDRLRSWATHAVVASCTLLHCIASAEAQPRHERPAPTPWQLRTEVTRARIYVDLSASMQGYDRTIKSPLRALARELKSSLVAGGVTTFEGVGFGTTLDAPVEGAALTEALAWKANKPDTCLTLPIQEELRARTAPKNPIDRVMVVVTDGVASASNAGACGKRCAQGSDQTCLATAIRDYIQAGFALTVFAVKLPFSGTYYPAEGGAIKLARVVERPLYIWVGSPSVTLPRQTIADSMAWAGRARLKATALNVWPGVWAGHVVPVPITTGAVLAPPRHSPVDVCARGTTVTIDSLPSEQPAAIRFRSRRSNGQHQWAARIPLTRAHVDDAEGVVSLFHTAATVGFEGGTMMRWDLLTREPAALACLTWRGARARLQSVWTTTPATNWTRSFADWSEDFGRGTASDPSRTEGLLDMWRLTATLVARITTVVTSPLLDISVK